MDLEQAIAHAIYGEAVLFIGSGFSVDATKESGEHFNQARDLAHLLMKDCGYSEEDFLDDLGDASQLYLKKKSNIQLVDFLRNEFKAVEVNDTQKTIASINWRRVYTTNYDNVFELSALKNGKATDSVVLSDSLNNYYNKSKLIVHINGYINRLTVDKLNNEFKLTARSYLTDGFNRSEWKDLFMSDLKTAKAIFFVGYSLRYDLDIKRTIINIDPRLKEKTFFIVDSKTKETARDLISEFGQCFTFGSEVLAQKITVTQKKLPTLPPQPFYPLCFEKVSAPKNTYYTISATNVFDLLFAGKVDNARLFYSLQNQKLYKYAVSRTKQHEIIDAICSDSRNILIHSDLGNGKTLLVEGIATLLAHENFDVYKFTRENNTLANEIEQICKSHKRTVLIFDGYYANLFAIGILSKFRTDQIVIVAERSSANDFGYFDLVEKLGEFKCFNVNELDYHEKNAFSEILTTHGFWGKRSSLSDDKKIEFISRTNKSQIRNLILSLFESEHIIGKFQQVIDNLKTQSGYYDAIIFMLFASLTNIRLDIEDLAYCMDIDRINSPAFRNDRNIREFIDFTEGRFTVKSAIVAKVLLNRVSDTSIITGVLLKVFKHISELSSTYAQRKILKSLMLFSNIQSALGTEDARYSATINDYYDKLKTFEYCRENEQFWLQYAIVKLSQSKFPEAEVYFQTAYSYAAKQRDYDTYKIDSHYAKYLLLNARNQKDSEFAAQAFKKAHSLLSKQSPLDNGMFYPLIVSGLYWPIYDKFFEHFSDDEQTYFIQAYNEMMQRINSYLKSADTNSRTDDVQRAYRDLRKIEIAINGKK